MKLHLTSAFILQHDVISFSQLLWVSPTRFFQNDKREKVLAFPLLILAYSDLSIRMLTVADFLIRVAQWLVYTGLETRNSCTSDW